MNKLEVGQKVFLEEWNHRGQPNPGLIETTITKVGNKYFYVDYFRNDTRFYIDGLKNDANGYSSRYFIWLSDQDYFDKIEITALKDKFRRYFDIYNSIGLSLESLRQIDIIIANNKESQDKGIGTK